jgi:hypothetical protein
MQIEFNSLNVIQLFFVLILIIFPGLVAMRVYRLVTPAKEVDWQNAVFESSFWGTVNILFASPFVCTIVWFIDLQWEILFVMLVFFSISLPIIWVHIRRRKIFSDFFVSLHLTAWDYYFSSRSACFVLVHLKDGKLIGGYYGKNSLASHFPEKMSLYLEKVIKVDENGNFGEWVENSKGVIIDKDVFNYVEVFHLPMIKESSNVNPK